MAALATAAVIGRASSLTTAGSLAVAGHGTERAGGRPHQDARLVHLFNPCLVDGWLTGGVDRDVENPVPDRGFDAAPISPGLAAAC
jgi:hypothetical protein